MTAQRTPRPVVAIVLAAVAGMLLAPPHATATGTDADEGRLATIVVAGTGGAPGAGATVVAPAEVGGADDVVAATALPRLGVDRLVVPAAAAERVLARLRAEGREAWIDPAVRAARVPDDPGYGEQWALHQVNADRAWDRTVGDPDVVVAVVDSGIAPGHPDLAGALVEGWDFVDGDATPHDVDGTGHGTAVAGIIAARTDNGRGIAGVCWRCRVMPLRVLDRDGRGTSSDVVLAIYHAVDTGADVINMSLVADARDRLTEEAVAYAVDRGVLVVGAAGNDGSAEPTYPAAFDGVLGVAATTVDGSRASWSNHGRWASVAAPGTARTTTGEGGYGDLEGTSAAAPVVAGAAGLVRSVRPDLPLRDVRRAIEEGATPVPGRWVDHGALDLAATVPVRAVGGNLYRALDPARILDTRTGHGGRRGPLGPRESLRLRVTGVGGVPASGVAAVVLTVTVTRPTQASYLTLHPTGTSRPLVSNLNFVAGQTVPNLATVQVGRGGAVDVRNHAGRTHVVVDVAGYYLADGGGSMFVATTPARLVDTRDGTGGHDAPVSGGTSIPVRVAGRAGVPRHGVTAVAVNVTATNASRDTYLTLHPAGTGRPATSVLNVGRGDTLAIMSVARLGRDGRIRVFNFAGRTDVVVDVMGYFTLNERGARFHPLAPQRAVDTRVGRGGPRAPIGHRATRTIDLTGTAGVPGSGVSAVVANVTGIEPTASETYLSVYPAGRPRPTVSTLNLRRGRIVPNLTTATTGPGGAVEVYNNSGRTHVVVDVAGYYTTR